MSKPVPTVPRVVLPPTLREMLVDALAYAFAKRYRRLYSEVSDLTAASPQEALEAGPPLAPLLAMF